MRNDTGPYGSEIRRFLVGLFVAYAILIQALASPYLRAQAADVARLDAALGVLCLTEGAPGHEVPGERKMPHGHGLECCLPGLRFAGIDLPALAAQPVVFNTGRASLDHATIVYPRPETRAPPSVRRNILQPRAPPSIV